MDEFLVIAKDQEVNVWADEGDVLMAVDGQGERTTVKLNPLQVERLIRLLQNASAVALEKVEAPGT